MLILALSAPAGASEFSLIVGGFAYHIGESTYTTKEFVYNCGLSECPPVITEHSYNETNETIGIGYGDNYIVYSKLSYDNHGLAIYNHTTYPSLGNKYLTPGLRLGFVYGYKDTPIDQTIVPLISPTLTIHAPLGIDIETGLLLTSPVVITANIKYTF